MIKIAIAMVAALTCFSVYAFKSIESEASNFLQKLGIPAEDANDLVWSSFSGGYLSHPGGVKLRQIAVGERAEIVKEIAEFAKQYTRSEEFAKKYKEYREGRKPDPPEAPKSMDQQKKEQRESLQKSIRETEANMKSMPADQKDMMKGVVKMFKDQLKSLDDPNNPMYTKQMEQMQTQMYESQMSEYKTRLAKWENDNPSVPTGMIKRWLNEFLNVSKDVDFKAALIDGDGGKKLFAKTEYERKPDTWKMCFRAGKETVEAGRAFAKQWVDELNKSK